MTARPVSQNAPPRFRCSACGRRRPRVGAQATAARLICEMSHDNDVDFATKMSEPQWAQLAGGVERMTAAGCAFSDADVETIASGERDDTVARFGAFDGWEDVDRVLTWVFDGEES